ncbi:hypothetical protein PTKIN_Ptkin06aG0198600 [Pterospermum kingtungense]
MEEIIECKRDEVKAGIVFSQLNCLQLSCLPSLSGFCLRDHVFEFPSDCEEMPKDEDFLTPLLHKVMFTEDEDEEKKWWEGNLKTTTKLLFEEMNVQNSEEV